jgi:hypothetical protein
MSKQPLPRVSPGQGQLHIPRNAVDRGFDNYLSISGGGGDTRTDSLVPIWTKSDVRFEATKELLVTASNLERAAKVLEDYTKLFINIGLGMK